MTDKNTFYNMLKTNAESRPDAVAVVYDTMKVTYAKLFDDVTKKALHFQKYDGERIAIFGQASYRWIVNMFGTIRTLFLWISSFRMIRGLTFLRKPMSITH